MTWEDAMSGGIGGCTDEQGEYESPFGVKDVCDTCWDAVDMHAWLTDGDRVRGADLYKRQQAREFLKMPVTTETLNINIQAHFTDSKDFSMDTILHFPARIDVAGKMIRDVAAAEVPEWDVQHIHIGTGFTPLNDDEEAYTQAMVKTIRVQVSAK